MNKQQSVHSAYALEVSNVCKTYPSNTTPALKNITFSVGVGRVMGLIGPNGSGKSTLLRILSSLLTADAGEVRIWGDKVVHSDIEEIQRCIGRVGTDAGLYSRLTAQENILFAAQLYGLSKARAWEKAKCILLRFGHTDASLQMPVGRLSRGQQQKVAIARAFIHSPRLLILDEPTTGLDPRSKLEVHRMILELNKAHEVSVILASHDLQEVRMLCDEVEVLVKGEFLPKQQLVDLESKLKSGIDLEEAFYAISQHESAYDSLVTKDVNLAPLVAPSKGCTVCRVIEAFGTRHWLLLRRSWLFGALTLLFAVVPSFVAIGIGKQLGDQELLVNLVIGAILLMYLNGVTREVGFTIAREQQSECLELIFAAPVSRVAHLVGVGIVGLVWAIMQTVVLSIMLFYVLGSGLDIKLLASLLRVDWLSLIPIVIFTTIAFFSFGIALGVLPLVDRDYGAFALAGLQAVIFTASGIFYSLEVLPLPLQFIGALSPATYAMSGLQAAVGVSGYDNASYIGAWFGVESVSVLTVLIVFSVVYTFIGGWVFWRAEMRARRTGDLYRRG